jgi:hypothetical protein
MEKLHKLWSHLKRGGQGSSHSSSNLAASDFSSVNFLNKIKYVNIIDSKKNLKNKVYKKLSIKRINFSVDIH